MNETDLQIVRGLFPRCTLREKAALEEVIRAAERDAHPPMTWSPSAVQTEQVMIPVVGDPRTDRPTPGKATAEMILDYIGEQGALGATDEEMEIHFGALHQSVSSARRGLVKQRAIMDSGRSRRNQTGHMATVWISCQHKSPALSYGGS